MELTTKDFEHITRYWVTEPKPQGYIAYLGDKQFKSSGSKTVFKSIGVLKQSLRYALEYQVKEVMRKKLIEGGVLERDLYDIPEYQHAYESFFEQATKSGYLKIVELTANK